MRAAEPKRDWRIYSTPHFELLTDGTENAAEAALTERLNLTPDQLQAAVVDHIHHGRSRTAGYRRPDDVQKLPPPRKRPASPGEVEVWMGDWAFEQDPVQAEARYRRSLQEEPGNVLGRVGLGRCQAEQVKVPEALETLRKATQADPKSGSAWLFLARIGLDSADHASDKPSTRLRPPRHRYTATGSPRTSSLGRIPSPGSVDADNRPWSRCGAPSAMDRVT